MNVRKVRFLDDVLVATNILNACGKDMAKRYDIHHWDNPWIKTFFIVLICLAKNNVYVVEDRRIVATYQTKKKGSILYFEKLAVMPEMSSKGIGSFCLRQIETEARENDCKKVQMDVYSKSQHAIQFYQNHRYSIIRENKTLKYEIVCLEKVLE